MGKQHSRKLQPTKICTHEALGTVIMEGYCHAQKFIPQNNVTIMSGALQELNCSII